MFDFLATANFWVVALILAVTAASCSILGVYLVLRRMALLTDAIGHVLLLGIVLVFLVLHDLGSPLLLLGAAATGLGTVALVEGLTRSRLVKEDAAIGLVFPALFALGIVLATIHARNMHLDVDRVLLGIPELVALQRLETATFDFGPRALVVMSAMLLLNSAFVVLFYKELKLATFDALLAATLGFMPILLHYALMTLVSLTAVTAFDAAGPVLVVAFFVVPPATAYLLTDRLSVMLLASVGIAIVGAILGTTIANLGGVTTAGTTATTMGGIFATVYLVAPQHGLLARWLRRRQQRAHFYDTMLVIHLLHHEGTPQEAEECRIVGLPQHLHWPPSTIAVVVQQVMARGWAKELGGQLLLTPLGREAAEAVLLQRV